MPLKLLIDECILDKRLSKKLRDAGHDLKTVGDLQLRRKADHAVFEAAIAAELSIKACLFRKLQEVLSRSKLNQAQLAKKLGVKQPHVSEILNGRMSGFSTERLAKYLLRLNYDICRRVI